MCSCLPPISHPYRFHNKAPISRFLRSHNPNSRIHRRWLSLDCIPALFQRSSSVRATRDSRVPGDSEVPSAQKVDIDSRSDNPEGSSGFDFLGLKREVENEGRGVGSFEDEEGEELVLPGISGRDVMDSEEEEEEEEEARGKIVRRRTSASGRQMLKRSSLLAKPVISMRSACSLGFVSQIWVDTRPWLVVVVEVRPSILSGESEKFLLEDVCQVGDVMLIEDETVAENEVNLVGLDTLVRYSVVTSDRYNVGKVRDFNFNINSGAVESLELDPFGMSIIPASLVSTYSLLVEDILEIKSDKIVVHDGAVSRMQRLSKGLWDTQSSRYSGEEIEEFSGFKSRRVWDARSRSRSMRRRRVHPKWRDVEDDWDLPMEY